MRQILIDKNSVDLKCCAYRFPWDHDSHCYNFKMPTELVLNTEINSISDPLEVETLVIGCDLNDYTFISKMENLKQLYLYAGEKIENLEFIHGLVNLNQLYISESKIKRLDELVDLMKKQKLLLENLEGMNRVLFGFDAICVNSSEELNGKDLLEAGLFVSEIIVNNKWIRR
ncbi:MAG: hypothetical protein ACI4EX_04540 [Lachnospiraceae bacterium]